MDDKFNTAAGWVLFAGIIALGSSIVSGMVFHADSPESPEQPGYFIDAPEEGEAAGEMSVAEALTMEGVDAAAGEKVFAKCTACHTINSGGAAGIGPNLHGIMGAAVAGKGGFAYSSALQDVGGQWGWDNMSEWLKSPRAFANGTKMSFAGLSSLEDRAAVMLYMNEQGSGLPIPEFVPEVDAEGEEVDGAGEGPGAVEGQGADAAEAAGSMGDEQPVPSQGGGATQNDGPLKPGE